MSEFRVLLDRDHHEHVRFLIEQDRRKLAHQARDLDYADSVYFEAKDAAYMYLRPIYSTLQEIVER